MSTILGRPLYESGLETVATDMPGYAVTKVAEGVTVKIVMLENAGHYPIEEPGLTNGFSMPC